MIVEPKVRGFICTTTHPVGCQKNVEEEIDFFKKSGKISSNIRNVLIVGGSTGYGLSSRIMSNWCLNAATLNICIEREPSPTRFASPGWYNTKTLEKIAKNEGLYAQTIFKDGFLHETKKEVAAKIKKELGKIDMLVYSVAAARRLDESDGKLYQSALKPIGNEIKEKTVHWQTRNLTEISIAPASEEEIQATIKVMGGEDWQLWVEMLMENDLISKDFLTVAYSYVGPEITQKIYRQGTIGQAKKHLEKTTEQLNKMLKPYDGRACISVNKAIVTQAASAIPIIPLYLSILFKVMREKNLHEGAAQQIDRLFRSKIFADKNEKMIRMDDWEMQTEIQKLVHENWHEITQENLTKMSDIDLYGEEFLKLFGFCRKNVDYKKEVDPFL